MNEPDFDNMTPAQIDEYLLSFGMDPVKIREHGRVFMGVLLEKIDLQNRLDAANKELDRLRPISGELPGLLRRWALADTTERAYIVEEYIKHRLYDSKKIIMNDPQMVFLPRKTKKDKK